MSAPPLSKLVRFLLIAAGLIIVLSVIWSFIDSAYSQFLANVARSVVPGEFRVKQTGATLYFIRQYFIVHQGGQPVKAPVPENYPADSWIDASSIQFGILLTVALMAATPGLSLRRRFLFTGLAVAIAFVLQVLAVIVMAKTRNSLLFVIVSDVFPPILWAVFSFKYWFGKSALTPVAQNETPPPAKKKERKTG